MRIADLQLDFDPLEIGRMPRPATRRRQTVQHNPPAFPTVHVSAQGEITGVTEGLTLRDYFAARAMAALIPRLDGGRDVADCAYAIADAMLRARNTVHLDGGPSAEALARECAAAVAARKLDPAESNGQGATVGYGEGRFGLTDHE